MGISTLESILSDAHTQIDILYNQHKSDHQTTFLQHVAKRRESIFVEHEGKVIIYFDTNAWKCISDYLRKKTGLTQDMVEFCELALDELVLAKCVFPIGLITLFELQSMTDPLTIETLASFIDSHSKNICIAFDLERIEIELNEFRKKSTLGVDPKSSFFRRPFELFGVPSAKLPEAWLKEYDQEAFNKALYDYLCGLPASTQLQIAAEMSDGRWDNTAGIAGMNQGKADHQDDIPNFNTAVFIELAGVMSLFVKDEPRISGMIQPKYLAAAAMMHWKEVPNSRHFVTARVLANLHGLMRYDKGRQFKNGDIADFAAAASALPIANAFFTDKRLAFIASDAHVEIKKFTDCEIISGFSNFAKYLKSVKDA